MKKIKIPNLKASIYDLREYKEIIEPFCNLLLSDKNLYFLGPDDEKNKLNIWETYDSRIKLFESILDYVIYDFLFTEHPKFQKKEKNFSLDKDSWLNTPSSWQGQRIHRHWQPFLRPDEIGDVTTVLYFKHDETINMDNGCFEFYENLKEDPLSHVWLPENLNPIYKYAPVPFTLIVMTSDVWHRAKPFTGERYSLATDAKAFWENSNV